MNKSDILTLINPSSVTGRIRANKAVTLIDPSRVTGGIKVNKGFTLIELLVVISIIALLSSVVIAAVTKARVRARDSQRIQNARQIAIALEQYEATFNTYKVANSGLTSNNGSGFVAKSGGSYSTNSILSSLKAAGLYTNTNLTDPIFGDNYYLGLCTSTNAYNVFVKMEQPGYGSATNTIANTCGGAEASTLGFNFIASTAGGSSGGGGTGSTGGSGFGGAYESGMSATPTCGTYSVVGQDALTYGTVLGADNRCWLDRNLGAIRLATAFNDYQAYGDLYQWGRGRDGHELVNHTSATAATAINGNTATLSSTDVPGNNLFIKAPSSPYDWRSPQNNNIWQGVSGVNSVCPTGFRLPLQSEWAALVAAANITNSATAFNSSLKLTLAGFRYRIDALFYYQGTEAYYWSSSVTGIYAYILYFTPSTATAGNADYRAGGFSVRCIRD